MRKRENSKGRQVGIEIRSYHLIPVTQSPTTPSSKRLQQHPLTFAVTPPPGRSRTPTSHKPFVSPISNETSPKALSPVIEQQPKVENISTPDVKSRSESFVDEPTQNLQSPSSQIPVESSTNSQENSTKESLNSSRRNSEVNSLVENGDKNENVDKFPDLPSQWKQLDKQRTLSRDELEPNEESG